jgi:prephenate dehydratase
MASIAYLGPAGTYTETAALDFAHWLQGQVDPSSPPPVLLPQTSITQTLQAVVNSQADYGVVPVENSIEGSVTMTLDGLWRLDQLQVQAALVLPIVHCLLSQAHDLSHIEKIYSHPQALAQCQLWLDTHLPQAARIPTNSNTEAMPQVERDPTLAAIASQRAADLYGLPILASAINDYPGNCTRFWAVGLQPSRGGSHLSLAFSVPENIPGALVRPLQVLAQRHINMSRIESRPTKRSLGEYVFFVDVQADPRSGHIQAAIASLKDYTETLKVFGSYEILAPGAGESLS